MYPLNSSNRLQIENYQLEHMNNLLQEENLIMKERSFGIDQSMKSLVRSFAQDKKKGEENQVFYSILQELESENSTLRTHALELTTKLDFTLIILKKSQKRNLKLSSEKENLTFKYREKLKKMKKEVDFYSKNYEELKIYQERANKELELVNKEYEEVCKKLSSFKVVEIEKICVNCKKVYQDDSNFNWSCKTHVSQYSSEFWWCCGKTNKDDEGCKITFHTSKEDQEESVIKPFSMLMCTVIFI